MNEYRFFVDIVHPKSWTHHITESQHVDFVNKFVDKMNKKGFRAKVDVYRGPGGGAAVVEFDENDKPLAALEAYMTKFGLEGWQD